jgi:hypothetical protein
MRALRSVHAVTLQKMLPHTAKRELRRRAWLPIARAIGYPISSPRRPRPPLARGRNGMRLSHVLLASDLNPDYLEYWPSARRAWLEIVGIEPTLLLIAHEAEVPADLRSDPNVTPFAPIEGVHTALQAQCIRLLYPAVVDTDEAVLIADVDLYPLRRSYFIDSIGRLDKQFFVSYRDVNLDRQQVAIAYNAATPTTWSSLFNVSNVDDVRAVLTGWTELLEYDGRRAWPGWYTDQEILHRALASWPGADRRWWVLDDDYTRHRQLDRLELERNVESDLSPERRMGIRKGVYSDYICLFPYREHRRINDLVLELGLASARSR